MAGYSCIDSNVRNIHKRVNCTIEDLLDTQRAVASMGVDKERDLKGRCSLCVNLSVFESMMIYFSAGRLLKSLRKAQSDEGIVANQNLIDLVMVSPAWRKTT